MSPSDEHAKHAVMLDPDENGDPHGERGHPDEQSPGRRSRRMSASRREQRDSSDDEDHLGRRADRNVDHHGGGGLRA